jgi:N-acetyl-gamma-glutamyl-phosphate reductase
MLRISIVGGSGYTGSELIRILSGHPEAEITALTSERFVGMRSSEVFPFLRGLNDITFTKFSAEEVSEESDIVFLALPHKEAMAVVPLFLEKGKRVIDLSADYRIKDKDVYKDWYCETHQNPELLEGAVYGLPELHRERIKKASLIANPGCYATSIILGLAPLVKNGLVEAGSIVIDSKSGISGAGRKPEQHFHFPEAYNSVRGYQVVGHRHIPEIEQELGLLAGSSVRISFVPHVVPMARGILSTIFADAAKALSTEKLIALYRDFYQDEVFVRVLDKEKLPDTHSVVGSNFCDIGLEVDTRNNRFIVLSALDNLVKGASGQAVQNMNILCGFREDTGLIGPGLFP